MIYFWSGDKLTSKRNYWKMKQRQAQTKSNYYHKCKQKTYTWEETNSTGTDINKSHNKYNLQQCWNLQDGKSKMYWITTHMKNFLAPINHNLKYTEHNLCIPKFPNTIYASTKLGLKKISFMQWFNQVKPCNSLIMIWCSVKFISWFLILDFLSSCNSCIIHFLLEYHSFNIYGIQLYEEAELTVA